VVKREISVACKQTLGRVMNYSSVLDYTNEDNTNVGVSGTSAGIYFPFKLSSIDKSDSAANRLLGHGDIPTPPDVLKAEAIIDNSKFDEVKDGLKDSALSSHQEALQISAVNNARQNASRFSFGEVTSATKRPSSTGSVFTPKPARKKARSTFSDGT